MDESELENESQVIEIAKACSEDLEAVVAVDRVAFVPLDCWNSDLWIGMLKSNGTRVLTARHPISGVVGYSAFDRKGKIMKLAVAPTWQCSRIGTRLLDTTLSIIDGEFGKFSMGASLHVETCNDRAIRLYESRGFVIDCTLKDYYAPGRDAWRMLRDKV
jgi:ribosomal protein S18 acetylase RimI-like enzyme